MALVVSAFMGDALDRGTRPPRGGGRGVADDRFEIPAFPRFILQGLAALTMAYGAAVVLRGVGNLIGIGLINFGPPPSVMTVFCVWV